MAGVMIAAPKSGSGKTMITCGLLKLLNRRGWNPAPFKCGPDYIDGLFHNQVLGLESGNLDSFFEEPDHMREKISHITPGCFVVAEGVMDTLTAWEEFPLRQVHGKYPRFLNCPSSWW